jgi:hypothetical protein
VSIASTAVIHGGQLAKGTMIVVPAQINVNSFNAHVHQPHITADIKQPVHTVVGNNVTLDFWRTLLVSLAATFIGTLSSSVVFFLGDENQNPPTTGRSGCPASSWTAAPASRSWTSSGRGSPHRPATPGAATCTLHHGSRGG